MNINDIKNHFPNYSKILSKIEDELESSITSNEKYKGFIKIHDSFLYLFSDDINSTMNFSSPPDPIYLLYSEGAKRIRSSSILAKKGYYIDAVSLLRSVFELNKAINAIHNHVLSSIEYLGKNRGAEFESLDEREKERLINEHIRDVDNQVNSFDNRDIQDNLRPSIRNFKSIFHISVHKSLGNIAINYKDYINSNKGNLFQPHTNTQFFELYLNSCSFIILMYLRNILRSGLLKDDNREKIEWLVNFIEYSYSSMDGYHKDIVEYIKVKFQ